MNRYLDWLKQAKRDIESAKIQKENKYYEWACFISHQASEKALKSLFLKNGIEVIGHSLTEMINEIEKIKKIKLNLQRETKYLDRFYIPARYPNGWPKGAPFEYITDEDAENAINYSEKIIKKCEDLLSE